MSDSYSPYHPIVTYRRPCVQIKNVLFDLVEVLHFIAENNLIYKWSFRPLPWRERGMRFNGREQKSGVNQVNACFNMTKSMIVGDVTRQWMRGMESVAIFTAAKPYSI